MRGLLVVNPKATTTTARTRDVLVHALRADLDVEVVTTTHRGHATEVGRRAAEGAGRPRHRARRRRHRQRGRQRAARGRPRPGRPCARRRPRRLDQRLRPRPRPAQRPRRGDRPGARRAARGAATAGRPGRPPTGAGSRSAPGWAWTPRWSTPSSAGASAAAVPAGAVRPLRAQPVLPGDRARPAGADRSRRTTRSPSRACSCSSSQNTAPWTYLGNLPMNPLPDASFDDGLDAPRADPAADAVHACAHCPPARAAERHRQGQGRLPSARRGRLAARPSAPPPCSWTANCWRAGERRFRSHPRALSVVV